MEYLTVRSMKKFTKENIENCPTFKEDLYDYFNAYIENVFSIDSIVSELNLKVYLAILKANPIEVSIHESCNKMFNTHTIEGMTIKRTTDNSEVYFDYHEIMKWKY